MSKNSNAQKRGPSRNKRNACRRSRRANRTQRRRGGADGAPVSYSLAGSWPSRMSLGQGADYFKYHVGQHGGMGYDANMGGAPLKAISDSMLPQQLRMAAHIDGIDKAIADVRPLKDQMGGHQRRSVRRRNVKRKCWSRRNRKGNRKGHRKSNRRTRRRGGSMGYAPFPNKGMLLDSSREYAQAGLNPQWKSDVAFDLAKVRATQ